MYDKQVTGVANDAGFIDTFATFRAKVRDGDITIPRITAGEPLRTECQHFLECIAAGTEPLTSGRQALAVVRVLEAMQRSLANRGHEEPVTR